MAAYVGLDPNKDIKYVTQPFAESMRLLAEGKIDGFMAFPPEPQELRAKKIGHVIVNTITDRPWSRYFCCSIAGNREFVRKNPVADQARPAGDSENERHLRPRTRTSCSSFNEEGIRDPSRLCA